MLRDLVQGESTRQYASELKRDDGALLKWQYPYALAALPLCATLLWVVSLKHIDLRSMNDLGLISVLPSLIFVAVGLLTAGFCLALCQRRFSVPLLLLHLLILLFMLYGIAPVVEGLPRTPIAWKLVGIMDFVMQTGTVDPSVDAFHNWPGFFILVAFVTELLGFQSPLALATWAPVFLNLLYLGPLVLIFRAGTNNKRLVWLALWFFYLTNWIGQDYLAPQGFNYFFYLVILGILLQWFKTTPVQPDLFYKSWLRIPVAANLITKAGSYFGRNNVPDQPSHPWQRVGLIAIVIVIFVVIVPSHQLTPFATLAAVTALIIFHRLTPRGLPVVMIVVIGLWISYMAVSYFSGHLDHVTSPVGAIGENVSENLTERFRGSPEHLFIIRMRVVMTLCLWTLAFLGGIRRQRNGRLDLTFALLAIVPFSLIALQAYGGELLLRIYLFALPYMAFFSAALFYPVLTTRTSWRTVTAIGLVSLVLSIGFFFTRYGNERMDYFTAGEVDAVHYLYSIAEPGSQLLAGTGTLPWRFQDYKSYKYVTVERVVRNADLEELVNTMKDKKYLASYLILTRSQKASAELFTNWPPETWERFEEALSGSKEFKVIFANEDARIFVLASDQREAGP